MSTSSLGIVLEGFHQPVKDALQSASRLAFHEVELPAVAGEVEPAQLSQTGRRHLLHYVSGLGLQLSALGADLGGARFTDSSSIDQRLNKTRQILELAAELRVPVVTSHLGSINEESMKKGPLREVVQALAEISDRTGTRIAFDTGGDPNAIAGLLREINCPTIGACYDPASLLIEGFDPLSGVDPLADRILLAHIRDAVAGSNRRSGRETAIGEGQIDLAEYLAALDQAGYRTTPFIRRTQSDHPMRELADAKARIESLIR